MYKQKMSFEAQVENGENVDLAHEDVARLQLVRLGLRLRRRALFAQAALLQRRAGEVTKKLF
jgi:hypothetical protein